MMKDSIDLYDKVCHGIVPLYFVLRPSLILLEKCFGSPLTKFSFQNSNELSVLMRTLLKYMCLCHLKSPKVGHFRFMSISADLSWYFKGSPTKNSIRV